MGRGGGIIAQLGLCGNKVIVNLLLRYEDVLYLEDGGDEDHLQPYLPTVLKVMDTLDLTPDFHFF